MVSGSELECELEGHLVIPDLNNIALRIELRKDAEKNTKDQRLLGYQEIPVNMISTYTPEKYCDLNKPETGLRSLTPSKENLGHVVLNLKKIESETNPNIIVPNILSKYFVEKFTEVFNLESETFKEHDQITHRVCVDQTSFMNNNKYSPYQVMKYKDDSSTNKNFSSCAEFNIDCILSNELGYGFEKQRKLTPNQLNVPTGMSSRSPSVSPSRLSSFLPSASSSESINSVVSTGSETRRKISDRIQKISLSKKPPFKMVRIKDLLTSSMLMEAVEENIGAYGTIKINVDVDCQAKKLSLDDLKQIYKTFILKTISSKEPYQWDGSLPSSYQSILSILLSVTDGTIISKRDSISQAYIEAQSKLSTQQLEASCCQTACKYGI